LRANSDLSLRERFKSIEALAFQEKGIFETLKQLARLVPIEEKS
jgi:hypothetical protein